MSSGADAFTIPAGPNGPALAGESEGEGRDVLLCHGLSATRRNVVHGSRYLSRHGYRVTTYDARGHGESDPAEGYDYASLVEDLDRVIAARQIPLPTVLGGHSMGCHTVAAKAIGSPDAVAALILIGPVYMGSADDDQRWDARAEAMAESPEAFAEAVVEGMEGEIRDTVWRIARDRARLHRHPDAASRALRDLPRSRPFESVEELSGIRVPTLVVASHDEFDPGHPFSVAEAWAEAIPGAELTSEEPGESPLAWQGGRLSRVIEDFLIGHGLGPEA